MDRVNTAPGDFPGGKEESELTVEFTELGRKSAYRTVNAPKLRSYFAVLILVTVLERITRAGGENTVSKEHERILLRVDSTGDLLAKGHSDLTNGWIFKKKISSDWLARFRRTNEYPKY